MVITDYNEMSLEELTVINENLGISFIVEDGKVTGTTDED